jgi:hypothetical protein
MINYLNDIFIQSVNENLTIIKIIVDCNNEDDDALNIIKKLRL